MYEWQLRVKPEAAEDYQGLGFRDLGFRGPP